MKEYQRSAQQFLDCCSAKGVNPWALVRHVFWPATRADRAASLIAEEVGLCTLLRESRKKSEDRVYMHPLALQVLLTKGCDLPTFDKATVALIQKLCGALLGILAHSGSHSDDNVLKESMTLAIVCRIATCRAATMSLLELFCCDRYDEEEKEDTIAFRQVEVRLSTLPEASIAAFPGAEERLPDGSLRTVGCSDIPAGPFYSVLSDDHNLVIDSLISLAPSTEGSMGVLIGLQVERRRSDESDVKFDGDGCRAKHFSAPNVITALENRKFYHTLARKNPWRDCPAKQWSLSNGTLCEEVQLSSHVVKRWCPMFEYSVCDALLRYKRKEAKVNLSSLLLW